MSETSKRLLVAFGIVGVIFVALGLERLGVPGVYMLALLIGAGMLFEFGRCLWRAPRNVMFNATNLLVFGLFFVLLFLDFISIMKIGQRPYLLLLIFSVVCAADIGAWFFGRMLGGDKLWEKVSENKTWAGQIFGVVCGTLVAILYTHIFHHKFVPTFVWLGISLSLLSQYGDLTASFIKRKLKIKDFSNLLSVHGGILDRFDGWIYILPLIWMLKI